MSKVIENDRFAVQYRQSTMTTDTVVLVDRETGVNYLFYQQASAGGMTPLLNRDGTPLITSVGTVD